MEYRVKAKAKCVYNNVLYRTGEEFSFTADNESCLPDYVEVLFANGGQAVSAESDNTGVAVSPVNTVSNNADSEETGEQKAEEVTQNEGKAKNTGTKKAKNK